MIIVVGDTPSSVEINARVRLGDQSKMAAAQYVSSNRQRQSMTRLRILCLWSETHTVACGVNGAWRLQRRSKSDKCSYQNALLLSGLGSRSLRHRMKSNKPTLFCSPTAFCLLVWKYAVSNSVIQTWRSFGLFILYSLSYKNVIQIMRSSIMKFK